MREIINLCAALVFCLLLPGAAHAIPITFSEVQPDAVAGVDASRFFGPGSIQAVGPYFYLLAAGFDGDTHWQFIPLEWQATMRESAFEFDIETSALTGANGILAPAAGIDIALIEDDVFVSYLGWGIAHGAQSVAVQALPARSVPEPSSLALLLIGAIALLPMAIRAWRKSTPGP